MRPTLQPSLSPFSYEVAQQSIDSNPFLSPFFFSTSQPMPTCFTPFASHHADLNQRGRIYLLRSPYLQVCLTRAHSQCSTLWKLPGSAAATILSRSLFCLCLSLPLCRSLYLLVSCILCLPLFILLLPFSMDHGPLFSFQEACPPRYVFDIFLTYSTSYILYSIIIYVFFSLCFSVISHPCLLCFFLAFFSLAFSICLSPLSHLPSSLPNGEQTTTVSHPPVVSPGPLLFSSLFLLVGLLALLSTALASIQLPLSYRCAPGSSSLPSAFVSVFD